MLEGSLLYMSSKHFPTNSKVLCMQMNIEFKKLWIELHMYVFFCSTLGRRNFLGYFAIHAMPS